MANHFAKTASQDGTLRLFAGGKQIKSLVPLIDVARCFKFMEDRIDITNEIFNLTKETVTLSVAPATVAIPANPTPSKPPSTVAVLPSLIVCGVPVSPAKFQAV